VSGDARLLRDVGGVLGDIVDGLHDLAQQLEGLSFALVGGVAVLVHVQGHRVTEDIDSAVLGLKKEARRRLLVVADPGKTRANRDATVVLENGVPVDILEVSPKPLRPGLGAFREAKAQAVAWAIQTATEMTIDVDPPGKRGPITLPVASQAALVAMKSVSSADPGRGGKRATDLLDVWRLLSDSPIATAEMLHALKSAPDRLAQWTDERMRQWFAVAPADFMRDVAPGLGEPRDVAELQELWEGLLEPGLA
jgi:hypothetical protein